MSLIAETERLLIRQTVVQDAEAFFALNSDKLVLQYTGDEPFTNIEETQNFLSNYIKCYQNLGMGRYTVVRKNDQQILGWCGLKKHDDGTVDLGFRLMQKFWNQGFATEAGKACVEYGFQKLNLQKIIAQARIENSASIAVLLKLGFVQKETYFEENEHWLSFSLSRNSPKMP